MKQPAYQGFTDEKVELSGLLVDGVLLLEVGDLGHLLIQLLWFAKVPMAIFCVQELVFLLQGAEALQQ